MRLPHWFQFVRAVFISGFAGLSCLTNLQAQPQSQPGDVEQAAYSGPVSNVVDQICCENELGGSYGYGSANVCADDDGYLGTYYFC
ncbi:hypothetical protein GYB59_02270 [bacterium]|nr:hypothetical protein [bacterium]